jgi:thioredoxin-dependent peroxiredoxin
VRRRGVADTLGAVACWPGCCRSGGPPSSSTPTAPLKVVSNELRASVHADHALWFLQNCNSAQRSPHIRGKHSDDLQQSEGRDWFTEPDAAAEPSLVGPNALTAARTDVEIPLDAAVEALTTTSKPPRWSKHDVRGQILTYCMQSPTVGELAARLSLPLGATRFLVGDLVTQGYLRVHTPRAESMPIDERRELIRRTRSASDRFEVGDLVSVGCR